MWKHQIAQAIIIASVLGAIVALGSSCAPVSNSVPKNSAPRPELIKSAPERNVERIVEKTSVVGRMETADSLKKLPAGLKEIRLSAKELAELAERKAVILTLPGVRGAIRVYTVIEVKLGKAAIDAQKLDRVEARWKKLSPKSEEYSVTIFDESETNIARDAVATNLIGVTFAYAEIE